MKPSLSIIFFTVSSGAGLGLLALLALADLLPGAAFPAVALLWGIVAALGLVVAGLASSTLHLAKPSNAWRAFSRFRTSWLSREAVFSALLVPIACVYIATIWMGSAGALRIILAILVVLLAWAVLICTAMIYASLKPIRQWHTMWTPVNYWLLGHWSGSIIMLALAAVFSIDASPLVGISAVLGVATFVAKLAYWRAIADTRGAPTIERAIGVAEGVRPPGISVAQARLFEAGHSHRTFLTDEFVFRFARQRASLVRAAALLLAFGVPAIWLLLGAHGYAVGLAAALLCLTGLLGERWLFFAEARHTVRLYHGDLRT